MNNVFNIFNADCQAEKIVQDAEIITLFPCVAVISYRSGVGDQCLHPSQAGRDINHFQ
jgi:hypothetical protein